MEPNNMCFETSKNTCVYKNDTTNVRVKMISTTYVKKKTKGFLISLPFLSTLPPLFCFNFEVLVTLISFLPLTDLYTFLSLLLSLTGELLAGTCADVCVL